MLKRAMSVLGASLVACSVAVPVASAAGSTAGTQLPAAAGGRTVEIFASGVTTPTSFAFGAGRVFEGDGGNPPSTPGGVFVLAGGTATRLPDSPPFVAGLAWRDGTLYISSAKFGPGGAIISQILAWSGWNGTTFTQRRVFYTAPKNFPGFNGIAIGPDRRLYAGVDVSLDQTNDHGPATRPFQYDILSFSLKGKHGRDRKGPKPAEPKVFASGIRQPWQIAFARGDTRPYVTDLGQDADATNPPDFVLHVRRGDNYGFPTCNWTSKAACAGFATPFRLFAPHSDVGGIAIAGRTMYLSEFGMGGRPPQVVALSLHGHRDATPAVTGFPAPIVGLGAHDGWLYVGSLNGLIYRVHVS